MPTPLLSKEKADALFDELLTTQSWEGKDKIIDFSNEKEGCSKIPRNLQDVLIGVSNFLPVDFIRCRLLNPQLHSKRILNQSGRALLFLGDGRIVQTWIG